MDFNNDWKLVTIFIGMNDLCNYCIDQVGVFNDDDAYYDIVSKYGIWNQKDCSDHVSFTE